MPRTKQQRPKGNAESDHAVREFNRLVQLQIHKLELNYQSQMQKFDLSCQLALSRYPTDILSMTLRELMTRPVTPSPSPPRKENLPPKTPRDKASSTSRASRQAGRTTAKKPKRNTAASDDGYQSESTASQVSKTASMILGLQQQKQQQQQRRTGRKRTRSSTRESNAEVHRSVSQTRPSRLTSAMAQKNQKDLLKTPSNRPPNSFVITPKIKPNSVVNLLRKPKDGEMVFSTQGSPLLVSTTVNERTANINVPLQNGQVYSVLPFHETSLTEALPLDDETRHQLQVLQSHLAKFLK